MKSAGIRHTIGNIITSNHYTQMKKYFLLLCLSLFLSTSITLAQQYKAGEVIVKFKTTTIETASNSSKHSVRIMKSVPSFNDVSNVLNRLGVYEADHLLQHLTSKNNTSPGKMSIKESNTPFQLCVLRYDTTKVSSIDEAIQTLQQLSEVEYAEPNYTVKACSDYKSEPRYGEQWGLKAIRMQELWQVPIINTRRPIIAILDSGVETTHPDLASNIWRNEDEAEDNNDGDENGFADDIHGWNFVENCADVEDYFGHGTHCAGIAAAIGDNNEGICGANPDALIMPVKVLDNGGFGSIELLIQGLDYAVANGADIISMSLSTTGNSQALEDALSIAYSSAILLAAAGNENVCIDSNHVYMHGHSCNFPGPRFPAVSKFVIGVMATNESGELASFSNFDCDGPLRARDPLYYDQDFDDNQSYELKVPGENILSTYIGGDYSYLSGTSMACPLAAGAISRLLQCRDYSREELLKALAYTDKGNIDIMAAYQVTAEDLSQTRFTIEHKGVTMTFVKTSESTCQLGDCEGPAIDASTRGAVIVPGEVHGLSVTGVACDAFRDCKWVTEVELPYNVVKIGSVAFSGCTSLTQLRLLGWTQEAFGDTFDEETYNNCILMVHDFQGEYYKNAEPWKSFTHHEYLPYTLGRRFYVDVNGDEFPFVVTSLSPKTVEFGWFWQEHVDSPRFTVESAEIPSEVSGYTVTTVSENAFAGNINLVSVKLPPTIEYAGRAAFAQCPKLKSINIPEKMTTISECMFDSCDSLVSIDLPSSIEFIEGQVFCAAGIEKFTFPEKVTSIEHHLFCLCKNLKHMTIPPQIKRIGYDAFHCSGLETVIIGSGVEHIDEWAFWDCEMLQQIVVMATTPPILEYNSFTDYNIPLKVPKGCVELYQAAPIWKNFVSISEVEDIASGDANMDRNVTVTDIMTIVDYFLGRNPSPFDELNADVNVDGKINAMDIMAIANIILNK